MAQTFDNNPLREKSIQLSSICLMQIFPQSSVNTQPKDNRHLSVELLPPLLYKRFSSIN